MAHAPPPLIEELLPIAILVGVVAIVTSLLPKVDVGHSAAFRRRRLLNWLPLGLTYAFLYMARYNLSVLKSNGVITQADFGTIDGVGSLVYGISFLLNGPLTDRFGGRFSILVASGGTLVATTAMGIMFHQGSVTVTGLMLLYSANMYFQSFGAVSIVKVNASWFHLRERGTFGGIFGILISLGLYFAYDWGARILQLTATPGVDAAHPTYHGEWLCFVPAAILAVFWVLSFLLVRDTPEQAGLASFEVGDASTGQSRAKESAVAVIIRMMTNPVILTIALVELCSGFLRQGILKWFPDFAGGMHLGDSYIMRHWGMMSCIAGIVGGIFAGAISDHLFGSRRAPVASVLYGLMLAGALLIIPLFGTPTLIGGVVVVMAMAIIGVHGMLSGVASQDFGGRLNAGVAVGLIDGFVYLGSSIQSFVYGATLPEKGTAAAAQAGNWIWWPGAMIPVAVIGFLLALRLWNARVQPKSAPFVPQAIDVTKSK